MSVNDYNIELYEAIQAIVMNNELDEKSVAYGIAMQVVHQGHASLSSKQRYIYETEVESLLKRQGGN
jgi:hypothetical protein